MLINATCRWAICIYHGETSIFRKFTFPMCTRTTQLGIIRGGKKETSIYNSNKEGKGEGGGRSRSISRDGKRACHLIDCAGAAVARAAIMIASSLYFTVPLSSD